MNLQTKVAPDVFFVREELLILHYVDNNMLTVKLEPQVCQIFDLLLSSQEIVVGKESFIEHIWKGNEGVGLPALRKNIYKLRTHLRKANLDGTIRIETVSKLGYVLKVKQSRVPNIVLSKKLLRSAFAFLLIFLVLRIATEENFDMNRPDKIVKDEVVTQAELQNDVIYFEK